jgi:hypothetical protein
MGNSSPKKAGLRMQTPGCGNKFKPILRTFSISLPLIVTAILLINAKPADAQAVQIRLINGGQVVSSGATVSSTVGVVAQTTNSVIWVNYYVDGKYEFSSPPWEYHWDSTSAANGSHTITVTGYGSNDSVLGTQTVSVNVANGAGGPSYFSTLPVGATLPSESQCASWVLSRSSTELQPSNATANHTTPSAAQLNSFHSNPTFIDDLPTADYQNIDGNFTGTTDQIIRWASCKWGLDENAMRAEAWEETTPPDAAWAQSQLGDWTTNESDCQAGAWDGWNGTGCWKSYGIYQVQPLTWNVWSEVRDSTAFNADFRGGYLRACMNGDVNGLSNGYPGDSSTDSRFWGCMGEWYSGNWNDAGALYYISLVQKWFNSQPWLSLE